MRRRIERKDLAYDSIANAWHEFIDNYDTNRRIEMLEHDFPGVERLEETCQEGGCGLGDFSMEMLTGSLHGLAFVDGSTEAAASRPHAVAARSFDCQARDRLPANAGLQQLSTFARARVNRVSGS